MDEAQEKIDSLLDMQEFSESLKSKGIDSQRGLWNATLTVLGLFISSLSIIASLNVNLNKAIILTTICVCISGMFCALACFNYQTRFYSILFDISQKSIETKGQNNLDESIKKAGDLERRQCYAEKYSKFTLYFGAIGLALAVFL